MISSPHTFRHQVAVCWPRTARPPRRRQLALLVLLVALFYIYPAHQESLQNSSAPPSYHGLFPGFPATTPQTNASHSTPPPHAQLHSFAPLAALYAVTSRPSRNPHISVLILRVRVALLSSLSSTPSTPPQTPHQHCCRPHSSISPQSLRLVPPLSNTSITSSSSLLPHLSNPLHTSSSRRSTSCSTSVFVHSLVLAPL